MNYRTQNSLWSLYAHRFVIRLVFVHFFLSKNVPCNVLGEITAGVQLEVVRGLFKVLVRVLSAAQEEM